MTRPTPPREPQPAPGRTSAAVRNFWFLVAATVVAAGVLRTAVELPSGPVAASLTAASGLAALVSLTLAARILIVVTGRRAR